MKAQLPHFLVHTFIKRAQAGLFKDKIKNQSDGEVVIQMDLSENYECNDQNAIQSQHWTKKQITLFTAVAWFKNSFGSKSCQSYVFVLDYKSHDKYFVHLCTEKNLEDIRQRIKVTK